MELLVVVYWPRYLEISSPCCFRACALTGNWIMQNSFERTMNVVLSSDSCPTKTQWKQKPKLGWKTPPKARKLFIYIQSNKHFLSLRTWALGLRTWQVINVLVKNAETKKSIYKAYNYTKFTSSYAITTSASQVLSGIWRWFHITWP